ncbi:MULTISPECIES: bacillithiol biosynthesis cysteine-adding enzyme BshC [unclassified Sphingobacterium]|uniref:bacillithiol biosynthesis cysteine-adding enzyme BshC n=1 Tax=unclassified Sphingobacterium TaxID=2609468 RepID=UPI001AE4A333|nr:MULTISPECIES: bacillithiol biosynthesis cysteine-adding enzyme BshC [unclassified Sphingobacterium]MDR6733990.1 bacillithiol biosynthesis cysteine-adding enzyme BshC [Sphingobacterium sp. 2149]
MKATYIEYSETNSFSKTLLAYLAHDETLKPFVGNWPTWAGFEKQLDEKRPFEYRKILVERLQKQYGELLENSPNVAANIELLLDQNSYTITTGHQLNIFTGPLYFIFKIMTAIRLSEDLKEKHPDKNFIPVYWMATEDHDFEEINHTKVFGKKISWDTPAVSATGRMDTTTIVDAVKQYTNILGLSENSTRLTRIVEEAYLNHNRLADATRYMVNELFKSYGLLIIDADDRELKELFKPIIKEDIFSENSFKAITSRSEELESQGFSTQVHAREINFFYLTDEFRERLVLTADGRYEVLHQNIYFTKAELEQEIEHYPERFSPNVVMRPMYQEIILPNLAYIGGGAEMVYWMQLKSNFDQYQIDFPILIPRNSAMITDDKIAAKLFRVDLTFKSIFRSADVLKKEYVRRHTKERLNLNDEWMELNAIFGKIKLRTHKIDPSLGPSTEAVKARLKKAINNLEKKLLKAEKRNHQHALTDIDHVKEKLFPGGGLQERSENFALLYIKHGDNLFKDLYKYFNPLDFKFTILY